MKHKKENYEDDSTACSQPYPFLCYNITNMKKRKDVVSILKGGQTKECAAIEEQTGVIKHVTRTGLYIISLVINWQTARDDTAASGGRGA
jgi:Neuraminidase (sialidase)